MKESMWKIVIQEGEKTIMDKLEKEQKVNEEMITVDKVSKKIPSLRDKINTVMEKTEKIHLMSGRYYYECDRLRNALDGVDKNLSPLHGTSPMTYLEKADNVYKTFASIEVVFDKDISIIEDVEKTFAGMTKPSTISTAGATMLYDSSGLYEMNAELLDLPVTPPSVQDEIDPYAIDQPQVEKDVLKLIKDTDPDLEKLYLGIKEIFKTPQRSRLSAASSEMRKLIWEIFRKLAPHEKVSSAPGFKQIHKDEGVATRRQQIAFIVTGTANINGPEVELINEIFNSLDAALGVFSGQAKELKKMSNHQVIKTIARCERTICSLLEKKG